MEYVFSTVYAGRSLVDNSVGVQRLIFKPLEALVEEAKHGKNILIVADNFYDPKLLAHRIKMLIGD